jgi:collagenase-like PrtC family protease
MKEFRDKLIQDLYDLNVHADITIEELADDIIDDMRHMTGRMYVETFGSCPMCMDCPDGCLLTIEQNRVSDNNTTYCPNDCRTSCNECFR